MLSKKAKYALKALLYLGKNEDKGVVLISEISAEEGIPKKFLEQILLELKNKGFCKVKEAKTAAIYWVKLRKILI